MVTVLYTKASDYRSKKYNLRTEIIDIDGKRYARKMAVSDEARLHLEQIVQNAEKLKVIMEPECKVCPVKKDDSAILFDFVYGKSYEELLDEASKERDFIKVADLISSYHDFVYKMESKKGFVPNEKFAEIFGDFPADKDLLVGDFVDVDLIFSNVICGDRPYIIDYEWCFDFDIPLDYVFWKGLFTSKAFSILPDDIKNDIFDKYELSEEKRRLFLGMEIKFVERSKGEHLSFADEAAKMRPIVFDQSHIKWNGQSYPMVFFAVKDGVAKKIYEGISFPGRNKISFTIEDDYDRLEMFVAPVLSVISNIQVKTSGLDGIRDVKFKTTSEADEIEPRYFILNTPVILVKEKCSNISVEFVVDIWNSNAISENNLNEYLNSIDYVSERTREEILKNQQYESVKKKSHDRKVELRTVRQELVAVNAELASTAERLKAVETENINMRLTLQRKNIFKAFEAFMKLRKCKND